jgi:hypothetical protein
MNVGGRTTVPSHPLACKLGFWAAVTAFLTFVVYTICFFAILLSSPLFTWTSLTDYVAYVGQYGGPFRPLAQFAMLLFGLSFVVLLNAIHECARGERRILTRIGVGFGLLFAAAVGIHYFAQLSAVRLNMLAGRIEGLEHFVQANPYAVLSAINMLGWTVFLALASSFVAPAFSGAGLERVIRWALALNALFCLGGGIGYVWEITWLVFVTITLGMGGAVLIATAALALWFRRSDSHAGTASAAAKVNAAVPLDGASTPPAAGKPWESAEGDQRVE